MQMKTLFSSLRALRTGAFYLMVAASVCAAGLVSCDDGDDDGKIDGGAPFKTDRAEPEMTACLREALCLKGAFEGEPQCVLKIRLRNKPVREIFVRDNPDKRGEPVFTGGYLVPAGTRGTLSGGVPVRADDPFFDTHAIDSRRPDLRTD